jgi:hypothetical protein
LCKSRKGCATAAAGGGRGGVSKPAGARSARPETTGAGSGLSEGEHVSLGFFEREAPAARSRGKPPRDFEVWKGRPVSLSPKGGADQPII